MKDVSDKKLRSYSLFTVENILRDAVSTLSGEGALASRYDIVSDTRCKIGISIGRSRLDTVKIVNIGTLLNNMIKSPFILGIREQGYVVEKTEIGVITGRLSFFFTLSNVATKRKGTSPPTSAR